MKVVNMPRASFDLQGTFLTGHGSLAYVVCEEKYSLQIGDVLILLPTAPRGSSLLGVTEDNELLSVLDAVEQDKELKHFAVCLVRPLGVVCELES